MEIVVLAGGISTEREVSISTGTMVCAALREKGHRAILVDIYFGIPLEGIEEAFPAEYDVESAKAYMESQSPLIGQEKESRREFFGENVLKLCKNAEITFMALHGEDGENGKVQATFDLLGIRYTGSTYLGSALAMDKDLSKQLFLMNDIPTPSSQTIRKDTRETTECTVGFPCVVKPCCGGSSVGVYLAYNKEEFQKMLQKAFQYEDEVIVEAYIQGREFSIGVVGDEAYPIIEIAPIEGFYDYKNKYEAGRTIEICPALINPVLTKEMQECARKACRVLKLDSYARVDFLTDEEENFYCLEANTLPGMTQTSLLPQEAAALGYSFGDLCEKLIEVSMKRYK